MAGVEAFYDQHSILGENNISPSSGGFMFSEKLFCTGTVQFYHQPIGIIVANSNNLAQQAASKVKIYYTTSKDKPLLTIQEVLEANAKDRITHQSTVVASKKGRELASKELSKFDAKYFSFSIV